MLCALGFGLLGLGVGVSNANFDLERGESAEKRTLAMPPLGLRDLG